MGLLIVATFLSAFLMFQIELVIAKLFLPNYGGSFLVWGACIVFFQAVLLAGYVFAHFLLQRLGARTYLRIHLWLLLVPLLFFPIRGFQLTFNTSTLPLVVDIFWRLIVTIGPVFFVLSTMSLVTQSWLAASLLKQRQNPYGLYAVSNLGSLAALLTYPFIFERYLSNTEQLQLWRVAYLLLVGINVLAWVWVKINKEQPAQTKAAAAPVPMPQMLQWLILGAAGVVMFLSVTNIMTYEVAPVPLLWVIPLSIYLVAFILNFKRNPWFPSWIKTTIGPLIGLQAMMYFLAQRHLLPVILVIAVLCTLLFLICMYTQHQLIRIKPSSNAQMTLFYVMISLGGFLGGMLTSWIIPLLSNTLMEYLVGLLLVACTLPQASRISLGKMGFAAFFVIAAFYLWPLLIKGYHLWSFALLWVMVWLTFAQLATDRRFLAAGIAAIIFLTPWLEPIWQNAHFIIKKRNYYGIYEIYDSHNGVRIFLHGTTLHGLEFTDEDKRNIPLGYYSPISPIGTLLIDDTFQAKRIGVVGLGTGALSMYAKPNCPVDYYELDGDVKDLASRYFWYLTDAPGDVHVILGDARLSLKQAPDEAYDLLAIDAFSGDAIPTHLVNRDVLVEYRQKITPQGAVIFHVTNRYLNLEPVLAKMAQDAGAHIAFKDVPDNGINMRSIWCLLTWDDDRFLQLITKEDWEPLDLPSSYKERVWSDDYSTVLPIINMSELEGSLQSFNPLAK